MGMFSFLNRNAKKTRPIKTRSYHPPRDRNSAYRVTGGGVERVPSGLRSIRAFARDLAHNNAYAARAVSVLTAHTVGKGIRYAIRGDSAYETAFRKWSTTTACDHDGRLNLYGLQSVMVRTMFEAGEGLALVRDVHDEANGILFPTIQVIDPDLIDDGASPKTKDGKVFSGVEVDADGRVIGYHIKPDGQSFSSEYWDASDVIHFFEALLPGQVRGIPRGSQAIDGVNSVSELKKTAMAQAKVQACVTMFVTSETAEDAPLLGGGFDDEYDEDGFADEIMTPGTIGYLKPGQDVKAVVPSASGGLGDHIRIGLQEVASAYRCTYAQISSDLEKANFGSEKSGRLEFNQDIASTREHFIMPSLREIELRYRVDYDLSHDVSVDVEVNMTPPARETIEPAKEALAIMTLMAAGLMSWSQAARSFGHDPDELILEIAKERAALSLAGIEVKFGSQALIAAGVIEDTDPETGENIDPETGEVVAL
jgi:lambda family phage portal protein